MREEEPDDEKLEEFCPKCGGDGLSGDSDINHILCPVCHGTGQILEWEGR
jgi:DnaJ-class molecular chaperone